MPADEGAGGAGDQVQPAAGAGPARHGHQDRAAGEEPHLPGGCGHSLLADQEGAEEGRGRRDSHGGL